MEKEGKEKEERGEKAGERNVNAITLDICKG